MKKIITIAMLLFIFGLSSIYSQTTLYSQGFESGWPSTLSVYDGDGDGQTWSLNPISTPAHSGTGYAGVVYNMAGNNDWLFTNPAYLIPSAATTSSFTFWAKSYDATYPESFQVSITTDGGVTWNSIGVVNTVPDTYTQYTYNLSSYAGQNVGVSIICNSINAYYLCVDDILWTYNVGSFSIPTVTTTAVSSITANTAVSGGNVTSDGGAPVTSRGVCWSTSTNPTTSNSTTIDGSGIGVFSSSLTGLVVNTTYFVRAYATNSQGTAYGNVVSFTTIVGASIPTVTTTAVSSITANTAVSGGNVTSDGGAPVTSRGVCWSTSTNPTTSNSTTIDGSGIGVFSSSLTGLVVNTTYFVRAYATNSQGTAYGNVVSFTTIVGNNTEVYLSNIAFISLQQDNSQINVPSTMAMTSSNPENYLNPGYFVRFKIECYNNKLDGQSIVSGLCKLRTTDINLILIDSTSGLNNVGWGQSGWSTDEFEIQIKGTTPLGYVANVNFVVIEGANQYHTYNISIPVAPLALDTRTIDDDSNPDSNGNADGLCDPGEIIETLPKLKNLSSLYSEYNYGEFINYLNYAPINIWNNVIGSSGNVVNACFWNYNFGQPDPIPPGAVGMSPQFDFVFNYNFTQTYNFYLALKMSGKFELFPTKKCYVKWIVQIDYNFGQPAAPVSIDEIIDKHYFSAYPNPSYGIFQLNFDNMPSSKGELEIYNASGEKVYTASNIKQQMQIDLSALPTGIYFVQVYDGTKIYNQKIIVQ